MKTATATAFRTALEDLLRQRAASEGPAWLSRQRKLMAIDLGDFFQFSIERIQAIQEEEDPLAIRYHVKAELAGRRFEEFNLDVGIGRSVPVSAETLRGPDFFAFADLPPIEVPASRSNTTWLKRFTRTHAYTEKAEPAQESKIWSILS